VRRFCYGAVVLVFLRCYDVVVRSKREGACACAGVEIGGGGYDCGLHRRQKRERKSE
jgi:hypothetical protein